MHFIQIIQYLESDARCVTDHAYFHYKINHYIQRIAIYLIFISSNTEFLSIYRKLL